MKHSAGRSLRLALITSGLWPEVGGVERYVWRLAVELVRLGVEVSVLTPGDRTEERVVEGVRIQSHARPIRGVRDIPSPKLLHSVRKGCFDVVHGHHYHQLHVLSALFRASCPLIYTTHFHGVGSTRLRSVLHRLYRPIGGLVLRSADIIVVHTPAEARLVSDYFGLELDDRIIALPPGHAGFSRHPKSNLVLCVGRLVTTKRVDRFVEICASANLPPDTRCLIIGDGPERTRLENLAESLNSPVEFIGQVSDAKLADLVGQAKVVVSFSELESYGMAVADAAAAGIRVLASDIPAHRFIGALAGSAVSFPSPDTPAQWISALEESLTGSSTGSSPLSAQLPTWRELAIAHLILYRSLLDGLAINQRRLSPWGNWRDHL